uniref:Putative PD-(D/E)XK nuclease superfamily protein n=1 Tax=viral metagenome TaxID=1070528 RepID=A0A6M3LQW7_9ZZZZ
MIVDKINAYLSSENMTVDEAVRYEIEKLSGWTFRRQFMERIERDSKGKLYLSSVGKCTRQLAYGFHGFEKSGKEIDGRARVGFWLGDLIEITILGLAKLANVNIMATGMNQLTVSLAVNGFDDLYGHPDGLLFEDGSLILVEIKSMPSYTFDRFEKGEIDDSYVWQVNAYMQAMKLDRCCIVVINKNNSVFAERIIQKDETIIQKMFQKITSVIKSDIDHLPEHDYSANEKGIYPWQCLYCAYHKLCHLKAQIVFSGKRNILIEKKEAENGTE